MKEGGKEGKLEQRKEESRKGCKERKRETVGKEGRLELKR